MQNEVQKKGRELRYCQLRLMIVEMDQTFIWQSKLVGKKKKPSRRGRGLSQTQMEGCKEEYGVNLTNILLTAFVPVSLRSFFGMQLREREWCKIWT